MNPCNKLVSIIIPVYNAQNYIKRCVESIQNQSHQNFELILIDDASNDDSVEIIQELQNFDSRIVLHKNRENVKQAKSKNIGIKMCKGEFIGFLDIDDVALPHRIETQIQLLNNNDIDACGSLVNYVKSDTMEFISKLNLPLSYEECKVYAYLYENPFVQSTMMFKRSVFDRGFIFDEQVANVAEDYDLWLRMLYSNVKIVNISEVLALYSIGDTMQTTNLKQKEIIQKRKSLIYSSLGYVFSGNSSMVRKLYIYVLQRESVFERIIAAILFPILSCAIIRANNESDVLSKVDLRRFLLSICPKNSFLKYML